MIGGTASQVANAILAPLLAEARKPDPIELDWDPIAARHNGTKGWTAPAPDGKRSYFIGENADGGWTACLGEEIRTGMRDREAAERACERDARRQRLIREARFTQWACPPGWALLILMLRRFDFDPAAGGPKTLTRTDPPLRD